MASPKIGRTPAATSVIDIRRNRQTPKPPNAFNTVLASGASVLLSGAKIATSVVGLPKLSAAISSATRVGGDATTPGVTSPTGSTSAPGQSADALVQDMQKQRIDDDLRLLNLQSQIQQQNRQISMISNVMKARHDTAKSAIGNIRS